MALLKVDNLTKKFKSKKGEILAVDHVSFTANKGEIFGLLGPNGAGKTTTIRLIATTLTPTSGTAEVGGYDIIKQSERVRERIGVLTTDIGVYERFNGRENLKYYGQLYGLAGDKLDQRISELVRLLEMDDFIDKRAGKYSTGMKQKLAIARSVIHDPDIIIFDEPTAGLDVLASQTVIAFMNRAREQGKLVILSTHQMPDAEKLCDRVAIMHQGKLIANDTVATLKNNTQTDNLEDVFLKLVKECHLEARPAKESELKNRLSSDKKIFIAQRLRVVFLIVVILGIAAMFLPFLDESGFVYGQAFILIGALGLVVTKTYIKKHKNG